MTVFPTAAHLVSWANFAPIDRQSAGTRKRGSTGKGNPWLAATLAEIVMGLARTHSSWATATDGLPADAVRSEPWSPSATPC